jgi:hypothetical protein
MKKFLVVLGVCVLIATMPLTFAKSTSTLKSVQRNTNIFTTDIEKTPLPADDPPEWANGNFSGLWGLDIWGEWQFPIGWMFGYYKHNTNFGYFYAGFADFGQQNASWFIKGYFFGPFMFGSIGQNEYANETLFVGIGRYNDTNYHWRLMGEEGPTFFVDGTYTKF